MANAEKGNHRNRNSPVAGTLFPVNESIYKSRKHTQNGKWTLIENTLSRTKLASTQLNDLRIQIQDYKDDIVFQNQNMAAATACFCFGYEMLLQHTLEPKRLSYTVYPIHHLNQGRIKFSYKLHSLLLNQEYTYQISILVDSMLTFITTCYGFNISIAQ